MTEQEINSLPAGRELDALVAEKVMGWSRVEPMTQYNAAHGCPPGLGKRQEDRRQLCPHYSTDIVAAWEVVEKLRSLVQGRRLWGPSFSLYIPVGKGQHWCLELYNDMYGGMAEARSHNTKFIAWADSAPLAICRAALKAVASTKGGE